MELLQKVDTGLIALQRELVDKDASNETIPIEGFSHNRVSALTEKLSGRLQGCARCADQLSRLGFTPEQYASTFLRVTFAFIRVLITKAALAEAAKQGILPDTSAATVAQATSEADEDTSGTLPPASSADLTFVRAHLDEIRVLKGLHEVLKVEVSFDGRLLAPVPVKP